MKKLSFLKDKKYATYAKNSFLMMKMIEINLNYTKKSGITAIIQGNLEELLIIFTI